MKKLLLVILPLFLAACDDGDIVENIVYQQDGIKVAVSAQMTGLNSWPEGYTVTLSGFEQQRNDKEIAEYSEISKQILSSDGDISISLGGIPQSVNYLEDDRCQVNYWAWGLNYFALPNLVIKADYTYRKIGTDEMFKNTKSSFNNENEFCIAIAYVGWFWQK